MGVRGRLIAGVTGVAATTVFVAVAGWACTAQSTLMASTISGAPRSVVQVSGGAVALPEGQPVEVRWGSLTGPTLASITPEERGRFSANITIPDAPNGVTYLVAAAGTQRLASVPFQVTGSDDPAPSLALSNADDRPAAVTNPGDTSRSSQRVLGITFFAVGTLAIAGLVLVGLRRRSPASR